MAKGKEPETIGHQSDNTLRQSEEEAATPTLLALCLYRTDAEQLAGLAVFLNDSLTIEQPKTVSGQLMVENV